MFPRPPATSQIHDDGVGTVVTGQAHGNNDAEGLILSVVDAGR